MALETVGDIITSARYDLRDTRNTEFSSDNSELLDYFNRSLKILDSVLIRMDSDYVQGTDERQLSSGDNYVTLPATAVVVNEVWTSDDHEAQKCTVQELKRKRRFISTTGEPQYWALSGRILMFDYTADQDYTISSEILTRSPIMKLTDDAPYNDEFNEVLRQSVILMAMNRQEYDINGTAPIYKVFSDAVMARLVRRSVIKKPYKKDW